MMRLNGTIKFWDAQKQYGFIARDGQPDLYVSRRDILGDEARAPRKGEQVSYEVMRAPNGLSRAAAVCNHDDPASQAEFDLWNSPARCRARQEQTDAEINIAKWITANKAALRSATAK